MIYNKVKIAAVFWWEVNTVKENKETKGSKEWYEKLLTGDEKLILNGEQTNYSILQFWRLNLSTILLNMTRGSFAEFIVQCALDQGGFDAFSEIMTGVEPYDITGPIIPSLKRKARIEVKSASSVQIDTPDEKEPISLKDSQLTFSIRRAIDWQAGDEIARHNNDLYVFCHYTAKHKRDYMLDLKYWDFYVLPTFRIEQDPSLSKQNTISVYRLKKIGLQPCGFEELYDQIMKALAEIPDKK